MATRREISLMRTAALGEGEIIFQAAKRDPAADWIWLDLIRAGDDADLAAMAGRIGPIGPAGIKPADNIEHWRQLQGECARILRATLNDRREVFGEMDSEVSGGLWLRYMVSDPWRDQPLEHLGDLAQRHIESGAIRLASVPPLRVEGITTAGIVIARAIDEALAAHHILECKFCKRLFVLESPRLRAFCGGACRKASFVTFGS